MSGTTRGPCWTRCATVGTMTVEIALIIACCVIALLGVLWALLSWRRHYGWGRVVHGIAVTVAGLGLYFSGLLELLWQGIKGIWVWAWTVTPNNLMSTGLGLVAGAVVLWLIGILLLRKGYGRWNADERRQAAQLRGSRQDAGPAGNRLAVSGQASSGDKGQPKAGPVDDDMAEIEEILKNRGIQ